MTERAAAQPILKEQIPRVTYRETAKPLLQPIPARLTRHLPHRFQLENPCNKEIKAHFDNGSLSNSTVTIDDADGIFEIEIANQTASEKNFLDANGPDIFNRFQHVHEPQLFQT